MHFLNQYSLYLGMLRFVLRIDEQVTEQIYKGHRYSRYTYMVDGENRDHQLPARYSGTVISHQGYPNTSYPVDTDAYVNITELDPRVNHIVAIKFSDFDIDGSSMVLPPCDDVCSYLEIGDRVYFNASWENGNSTISETPAVWPPIDEYIFFELSENETFATFHFRSWSDKDDAEVKGRGFKFIYEVMCGNDTCPELMHEPSTSTQTLPVTDPPTSTQTLPVTDLVTNETLSTNTSDLFSSPTQLPSTRSNTTTIVSVGAGISLVVAACIIAAACYKIRSRGKTYERQDDEPGEVEHDWYRSLEPATAEKLKAILIKPQRLCSNSGNTLGEGYFGNIYLGRLKSDDDESEDDQTGTSQVAVKVLKDVRDIERDNLANKLVNEALLLSGFSHENVLNTLGICIPQRGQLCVVLPYMAHGDLRRFVKNKDTKLSIGDLMSLAQHVAKGMEYLSSNLFIHRDLAARNCLVGIDYIVKIADFGLSRDIYKKGYYTQLNLTSVPLPVKWTALEGLKDGTFTSFSDVWSFGVLVWELFSRGGDPYADVNIWEMKSYLEQERRLEAPQGTPPDLYKLMTTCWEVQPDRRPTFKEIVEYLDKSLGSRE